MVQFRPQAREIIAKVVYYGPPLGGKTTNLRTLYDGYPPNVRGEMLVVPAGGDRTIFFDFLPVDAGTLRGMRMRVQLYTVPGQVHYNATRQVVLRGVDAVVFVADSQRELLRANRESWENLKENLALQGLNLHDLPHVLQYNKRDLKELLSIGDLDQLLNEFNAPFFEAVASTGIGVEETLQGVVRLVARSLRDRFRLPAADERTLFGPVAAGALDGLSAVFNGPPPAAAPPAAPAAAYTPPVPTFGVSSRDLSLGAPVPSVAPEPALAPDGGLGAPIFRFAAPPDLPPAPHGLLTPPDEPANTPAAPPIPATAVPEFTVFAENELFGDRAASPASGVTGKIPVGADGHACARGRSAALGSVRSGVRSSGGRRRRRLRDLAADRDPGCRAGGARRRGAVRARSRGCAGGRTRDHGRPLGGGRPGHRAAHRSPRPRAGGRGAGARARGPRPGCLDGGQAADPAVPLDPDPRGGRACRVSWCFRTRTTSRSARSARSPA